MSVQEPWPGAHTPGESESTDESVLLAPPASASSPAPRGISRRAMLTGIGLGVVGVAAGAVILKGSGSSTATANSLLPALTPTDGGYVYFSVTGDVPPVAPTDYRLSVKAAPGKTAQSLSYADIAALRQSTLTRDVQCVTGWRVPAQAWGGVTVRDVLESTGADLTRAAVKFTSFDGEYTESLTMKQALRSDVLVATHLDGAPLTNQHGGPVRLYVAPMYFYKSLKWLGGIEVTDDVQPGYWEVRGYDVDAWVGKSNGGRDQPIAGSLPDQA